LVEKTQQASPSTSEVKISESDSKPTTEAAIAANKKARVAAAIAKAKAKKLAASSDKSQPSE
jgi:electron transport complex protein RnfC